MSVTTGENHNKEKTGELSYKESAKGAIDSLYKGTDDFCHIMITGLINIKDNGESETVNVDSNVSIYGNHKDLSILLASTMLKDPNFLNLLESAVEYYQEMVDSTRTKVSEEDSEEDSEELE